MDRLCSDCAVEGIEGQKSSRVLSKIAKDRRIERASQTVEIQ